MNAIDIARRNFPNYRFPKNKYVRGVYFKTKENLKLKKIVYRAMVPGDIRERIDITPLLDGGYILGPSVEKNHFNYKKVKIQIH